MSRDQQSFEEFKRKKELEKLRRKARGEETGEHKPAAPTPGEGSPRRERRRTGRLRIRKAGFGM